MQQFRGKILEFFKGSSQFETGSEYAAHHGLRQGLDLLINLLIQRLLVELLILSS
jgi:hypothetical protein